MTDRRRWIAVALGLTALGLGLRLYGLGWGLPAVYEEAYPFKKSWEMWGWGPSRSLDLNPHFFNYPAFYFYVQFLGQGLLYLFLQLRGAVDSVLDYRVLYALDKTPFYLMGRGISALCGAGTVLATFALGWRVGGVVSGAAAALLVAINPVHITKSQAIEVDVPLTLLATLCWLFCLRYLAAPTRRDLLWAALWGGLATATKYNGALLALPIFFAFLLARHAAGGSSSADASARTPSRERGAGKDAPTGDGARVRRAAPGSAARTASPKSGLGWTALALAATVFAGVLLVASPYIVLDRQNFWIGFNYERLHMRMGHFGLEDTPAFPWYLKVLTGSLLGWPLALLAGAGLVWFTGVKRRPWAVVLAAFPVIYVTLISSWSMKAERYVLPLLPLAAVFAAAFVSTCAERLRRRRAWLPPAVVLAATVAMAVPAVAGYARDRARLRGDTRTLAREWIEAQVPAGSLVVTESYGPEPMGVIDLNNLDADVRERIQKERPDTKVYAIVPMPMFQVMPENTALFYDLDLYDGVADLFVTSSSVSSRYRKDPARFAAQNALYDALDARWRKVREFGPADGSGPRITLYANPSVKEPFAARDSVLAPPPAPVVADRLPGSFSGFFERYAYNFEAYGHYDGAAALYLMGLEYRDQPPESRRSLGLGAIRTAIAAKRSGLALRILDELARQAPAANEAAYWRNLKVQLTTPARGDSAPAGGR